MHILFLTDNFPPEVNPPASRTFEHCAEWVKNDHQVTVITCAPNFPKGELLDGYKNRPWQIEEIDGIRIIRVWTYITANDGFVKRSLDYMSFMLSAFLASLFVRNVDIIIGTSPQFFTVCAAYASSVVKRAPWVFELRDIWPESIRAVGMMDDGKIFSALEWLELFLYRKADAIISVTHSFRDALITRGVDGNKVHVITNGVNTSRFLPRKKDSALIRELNLQTKFVVGYIGTHGLAHALNTILDAANLLKTDPNGGNFHFVFLGDGAGKKIIVERAREQQLANVIFLDSVPKNAVVKYWSILDASIIHLKNDPLFTTVIPSKLFECMSMAIPLLHGVRGESAAIVTDWQIGSLFEPEDAESLVSELKKMANDSSLLEKYSSNGPRAARHYDRRNLAAGMLKVLETVAR